MNRMIKGVLAVALSVCALSAQSKDATTMSLDEAQIRSNIQGFATLADRGAFEYLGRLLAPELVVDYSSLFGGQAATVTNTALMKQWAAFLPGFDATFHQLTDLRVVIEGDNALATVSFIARHYLSHKQGVDGETGFWSVFGEYEFGLNRFEDNWVINSVTLKRQGERGNRDVLELAPRHAEHNLQQRGAKRVEIH